jgi:holo-[acyl-carrier protein] synthase
MMVEPLTRAPGAAADDGVRARPALRIGLDLVRVADVAASVQAFGERYLRRIYTDDEIAYAKAGGDRLAERLAARFAAKEAARKVLRPTDGLGYRAVGVVRGDDGAPTLAFDAAAAELARRRGVLDASVSLSHEADYAAAVVVASVVEPAGECP